RGAGADRRKDFAMSEDVTAATTSKQWFVVHTYSGFENKVKEAIESRAKIFGMSERITRVLVPTEKVVEVRNKQKRETEQKFFPGYVLVEMELTDDTWHLVRSTPKVTGFVGSGSKPVALPHDQVDDILRQMEAGAEKPKPKSVFQRGDKVRVIDGPFVNFQAVVDDMTAERGGDREGLRGAAQGQDRQGHAAAGAGHRADQARGPQYRLDRLRDADHRRHCPQHGHRCGLARLSEETDHGDDREQARGQALRG